MQNAKRKTQNAALKIKRNVHKNRVLEKFGNPVNYPRFKSKIFTLPRRQPHLTALLQDNSYFSIRLSPVISPGLSRPIKSSIVGAKSAKRPFLSFLSFAPIKISGTTFVV